MPDLLCMSSYSSVLLIDTNLLRDQWLPPESVQEATRPLGRAPSPLSWQPILGYATTGYYISGECLPLEVPNTNASSGD